MSDSDDEDVISSTGHVQYPRLVAVFCDVAAVDISSDVLLSEVVTVPRIDSVSLHKNVCVF